MSKTQKKQQEVVVKDAPLKEDTSLQSTPPHTQKKALKIYLVAGEESGDMLGSGLMQALKKLVAAKNAQHQEQEVELYFSGVGGTRMQKQGLSSIFPMKELSVMGFLEVVPSALNILLRLSQTLDDIKRGKPDVVVTIDAPGFNFRLGKCLKPLNIPVIHYTAPTVWAWRPRRAERVATFLTHMLCLFPFEPPYFQKHGLATTFVGHPLAARHLSKVDPAPFIKQHNLKKNDPILCVMLGSRRSELDYHKPIFSDVIEILRSAYPKLQVISPTLPHLKDEVEHFFKARGVSAVVTADDDEKYQAMRASTAALVASGTATLELGLCEVPMVVAYRANPVSTWIVKQLIKTPYVSLVNILKDAEVVPEFLQEKCIAEDIAMQLNKLLDARNEAHIMMLQKLKGLQGIIEADTKKTPSDLAAEVVLGTLA